jgi:4'-phosphopantetheinyl transferase
MAHGIESYSRLLSIDEQRRAERFSIDRDRQRFIVARAVLRMILGHYLGLQADKISFCYGPYGKPTLKGADLSFNMSKTCGYAVYAVTRMGRIGIDVEEIRKNDELDQLAQHLFSVAAHDLLRSRQGNVKQEMFFRYWTRKEALVKAIGEGLRFPLHAIDLSMLSGEPIRRIILPDCRGRVSQWTILDLALNEGFAAAVAVEGATNIKLRMYVVPPLRRFVGCPRQ